MRKAKGFADKTPCKIPLTKIDQQQSKGFCWKKPGKDRPTVLHLAKYSQGCQQITNNSFADARWHSYNMWKTIQHTKTEGNTFKKTGNCFFSALTTKCNVWFTTTTRMDTLFRNPSAKRCKPQYPNWRILSAVCWCIPRFSLKKVQGGPAMRRASGTRRHSTARFASGAKTRAFPERPKRYYIICASFAHKYTCSTRQIWRVPLL